MEKTKNSHVHEYRIFKSIKPSMALADGENFADWQRKARAKLAELLGLPLEVCDGSLNVEWTEDREDHTEYRFTVETEPGYIVPCHLLIPKKAPRPLPLTVCLSGHCNGMHIALGVAKSEADEKSLKSWHHRAMAPRSLREGRAALVIEARSFGESSALGYGTSCTETAKIAILSGRTLLGERVWDAMRVLDAVLDRFGEIDPDDILCTGNSGGGTATYYLACMDERITTAAPSCSVCSFESSIAAMEHCMCNHVPSIRRYFEMGDLSGLIAPRRLIIAAGKTDPIFPIEGTLSEYENVKRYYAAADAKESHALVIGDGGHLNYADLIWSKYYEMKENQQK